jgi:cell division protein YceG involved in septum cleavage
LSRGDRSRTGRERTAAERERDRLERARRRAAADSPLPDGAAAGTPIAAPDSVPAPATGAPPADAAPASDATPAAFEPLPPTPPPAALEPPSEEPVAALGGGERTGAPRSRRRSWIARLSALLALAAVIVAVVALLHAHNSKSAAPPAPPPVVKVLIPEGKTRAQIAQIAVADRLKGSYGAASRSSPVLNPASYGAPRGTRDLEGFLFPATYDMNPGAPVARLVQEQLVAFQENFGASELARAHALHITPYQLLIVASMVEREAQIPGDRPKIAAVIYNRLAAKMPLGIDASIYYAVELASGIPTYTRELTEAQLHIDSPYNTRTHTGLPPTPISNPGVASIEAAAHPAHVSYLYYVAAADGCGEQVFSNTLAQFDVNASAYKAAVARNGGHPPRCKRTLTGTGK